MKYLLGFLFLASNCCFGQKLAYLEEFGAKIYFEPPDSSVWVLDGNGITRYGTYLLMFKHTPIKDSLGRDIQPVISLIIETAKDSTDLNTFVHEKMADSQWQFRFQDTLTYSGGYFAQRNAIGYLIQYSRENVIHTVYFCCIRNGNIGVTIICDSTDQIFGKVRLDMLRFLKSVGING